MNPKEQNIHSNCIHHDWVWSNKDEAYKCKNCGWYFGFSAIDTTKLKQKEEKEEGEK
jgi:hypothetical protein